jgi:hypothetical protein
MSGEQPKSYGASTTGSVFVFCNEEMHRLLLTVFMLLVLKQVVAFSLLL